MKGANGRGGITLLSILIVEVCFLFFFDEEVETILQSSLIQYICKKIVCDINNLKSVFRWRQWYQCSLHSAISFLFRDENDLFTTPQKYINAKCPGYVIKPIIGYGYCVIRSFQEGLIFCYGKAESLDSLLVELRSEIMKNYDFYSKFSTKDVNV